jgi:hypothetical protein
MLAMVLIDKPSRVIAHIIEAVGGGGIIHPIQNPMAAAATAAAATTSTRMSTTESPSDVRMTPIRQWFLSQQARSLPFSMYLQSNRTPNLTTIMKVASFTGTEVSPITIPLPYHTIRPCPSSMYPYLMVSCLMYDMICVMTE